MNGPPKPPSKSESGNLILLGEGDKKRVYVHPKDERRVIVEIKGEGATEKYSARKLEGAYLLTKIAHMLLPQHVPDIYQAGELPDGRQFFERQRIAHTPGHVALQADRQSDRDMEEARKQIIEEMGTQMGDVDMELERVGFGFSVDDQNVANYTKDEQGNVYYFEEFVPWESGPIPPHGLELLFDREVLVEAIMQVPDPKKREICEADFKELLVLFEEEKKEREVAPRAHLKDCEPRIKDFEASLVAFESRHDLEALLAIQTEEEAVESEARKAAQKDLPSIMSQLDRLKAETNITNDRYVELDDRYRRLYRAVGVINRGRVDHTR